MIHVYTEIFDSSYVFVYFTPDFFFRLSDKKNLTYVRRLLRARASVNPPLGSSFQFFIIEFFSFSF